MNYKNCETYIVRKESYSVFMELRSINFMENEQMEKYLISIQYCMRTENSLHKQIRMPN